MSKYQFRWFYRKSQNICRGKHWRIWRLSIDSPKFSHPSIVNTLKCNEKLTQFAKVLPFNYTSRVISLKFHPANILHYTVFLKSVYFDGFIFEVGVYFKVFVAVLHKLFERDDIIKLLLLNNIVLITVQ